MGISLDRTLKIRSQLKSRVNDLFNSAILAKKSHSEILMARDIQLYTTDYRRLPGHAQTYLAGYFDARMEEIWRCHIEWRHYIPISVIPTALEGQDHFHLFSMEETRKLALTHPNLYSKIETEKSCYVWKGCPDKKFT